MLSNKVWSADLELYATVYVRARSRKKAVEKIMAMLGDSIEVGESDDVSALNFDDKDLPVISLSPSMTITSKQEFQVRKAWP